MSLGDGAGGSARPGDEGPAQRAPAEIATGLTGDLRCLRCGYNLRGLSIRSACPECGLPVKATILVIVDPKAEELTPLRWPTLTAWGLVAWAGLGLAATVLAWLARGNEGYAALTGDPVVAIQLLGLAAAASAALSAAAAVVVVRPHADVSVWSTVRAGVGVLLQFAVAWCVWLVLGVYDAEHAPAYLSGDGPSPERAGLRLAMGVALAGSLWCLRPNLKLLAVRSVVVREGRVDRQSVLAVIGAVAVGAAGDGLLLIASAGETWVGDAVRIVHVALVALGSVLFTSGVINLFHDTLRLRPVLGSSGIGLSHIMHFRKASSGGPERS